MIDPSLIELLGNLKKVNELSNEAIQKLTQFLEDKEEGSSDEKGILTDLKPVIISLNEEAGVTKTLHHQLLTNSSECDEPNQLNEVESNHELEKEVTEDLVETTEQCTSKSTEDLNDKVSSSPTENGIESLEEPKLSGEELNQDQSGCNSDGSSKSEVKPLLKIVDFNKLVDPRNLELMDKNEKKKQKNGDVSIIILSSSDDEPLVKKKLPEKKRSESKSKNDGDKSVHFNPDVASTSSCDSKKKTNQSTQELPSIEIETVSIKSNHTNYMNVKGDEKFSSKPVVKLLRLPYEKLKTINVKELENLGLEECNNSTKKKQNTSEHLDQSDPNNKEKEFKSDEERKKEKVFTKRKSTKSSVEITDSSDEESKLKPKKLNKKSKRRKKNKKTLYDSSGEEKKKDNVKKSSLEVSDSSEEESKQKQNNLNKKTKHEKKSKKTLDVSSNEGKKKQNMKKNSLEVSDSSEEESDKVLKKKCSDDESEEKGDNNEEGDSKNQSDLKDDEKGTHESSADEENKKDKNNTKEEAACESAIVEESIEDQPSGEEKDSDVQVAINSYDDSENSDFGNFAKKNKHKRNKGKIKTIISDSEDEENGADKEEPVESSKESEPSDNPSDKEDDEGKIRKRKRIKQIKEDSSDSDEAVTRKKIKKLISKDSLSATTKKAAAEEKERKQRILEKQKKYNQIYESMDLANSKVEKLVLDVDESTEEPLLEVDKALVSKLKPHQASGIQFMWDACFESLKRSQKSQGSGCILAHCMGLGKTLQVIALTHTLLEEEEKTKVKKVLIVTPLSTVLNWKAEFKNWLSGEQSYEVYELVSVRAQNAERASYVREWHENGGVMIISYAMYRNLSNEKNRKISKKIRTTFTEGLVDPGPDLVVCDEGHLLKNEKTSLSIAMNKIKTRRRIILTGTPLQNNLKEYYCMVHFVKPSLLGTYKEYLNRFVNPITNGQYTDSTQYDINLMRRRSHVLHKLLDGIVQRRDYSVLAPYLPPKFEYVLFLTLSETQAKLYKHYMNHFAKSEDDGSHKASSLFKDFQALSRICIHPRVLLDKSNDDQLKYQSDEESIGSLKDFIDDGDDDESSTPESSESESDSDSKKKKKRVTKRVTRAQKNDPTVELSSEEEIEEKKEWWQEYCDGEELDNMAHSTKILLLFEILKECEQIGDKVLVFSQSLYALNLIEYFLAKVDDATQNGDADEKTCGFTGSWSPGLDYFRLDGSTNCSLRSEWCDAFNKESNSRARLFLLSTRAGGLGINLVAANRVIIFDVSWNPSSDVQSIYRVYRFGQLKPSYIYRFVIYGAMEMKIYERQVTKQAISKRVIDEQQIDRHYNQNDLAELYKFEEPDLDVRPTPLVPKDVLLGELIINHDDKIYKYHEHQSLLENKEDETLNEEERKAAWDEFENEKTERTKQALIGKFSVNTVQLALRSIIQRDNPTWNNNQILSIIPQLIQQLNLQMSMGDQTMYNRIAAEIKVMQDEYARKMQLQFHQHRLLLAQNQMQNMFRPQFPMMNMFNRMAPPNMANLNPSGSNLNPNEIVDLN